MRIAANITWNLLGTGLPMLVAVIAIPTMIEAIGMARYGVLSVAWIIVGYFGFFDLGLGRAMTQLVARKLGKGEEAEIPALVWAGMALMTILGMTGALLISLISPWLVGTQLEIPEHLRSETLAAFHLLAVSIPVVICTTALRGILEAYQRFDLVNMVRIPIGVITYLGPLAILPYSHSLPAMVLTLVAARIAFLAVCLAICLRLFPELGRRRRLQLALMRQLLSFGGWMTLSNIAAPLLLYLGRFLVMVLVSVEAVAYFSTPYDVVINLLLIPGIFVSVLFPAFARLFPGDAPSAGRLYGQSVLLIFVVMLPLTSLTYMFAQPVLAWWINEDFAANGHRVAQLIAIGIFINSFGHLSQALIQAYGRPDLTAKLHVAELVAYVPYLYWLVDRHGIEGAAMAWIVRVTISTLALWGIANRCLSGSIGK